MENHQSGFTLIEMLITVFIVSVGLIGVMSFFNASLSNQFEAKNEVVAAGLAQEGGELVRNLVEFKKLGGKNWATIVAEMRGSSVIDYRSLDTHAFQAADSSTGVCLSGSRYKQCNAISDVGEASTDFSRTVTVECGNENGAPISPCSAPYANVKSLRINCSVSWLDHATNANDIIYENEY